MIVSDARSGKQLARLSVDRNRWPPPVARGGIAVFGLIIACSISVASLAASADAGRSVAIRAGSLAARVAAEASARNYLRTHLPGFGLIASDVGEMTLSGVVPGTAAGLNHVYLQQNLRGIPVWNGIANFNVRSDGSVLNPGSRLIGNLVAKAGSQNARKSGIEAAQAAAQFLGLTPRQGLRVLQRPGGAMQKQRLSDAGIASAPISAELVWFYAQDMQQLRLAWRVQIAELGGAHYWNTFVDAQSAEPLAAIDRIIHERAASGAAGSRLPMAGLVALAGALVPAAPMPTPAFASIDGSSYTVFPMPYESPSDGSRVSVSGAANPVASPYGWHDSNGASGAEYRTTRGNNVFAYVDADADNVADPGSDPDGGGGLDFSFPLLAGQDPTQYRPAAVTNLFYWNNIVHDLSYNYGFNEASGNFQSNNYGKGGAGGDEVLAEAQDGSGTDNANFDTPPEGLQPRMQMYQWLYPFPATLTINSPAAIAGNYVATSAAFGPTLASTGPRSGNLVLVNDGVGSGSDGCQALLAFPAGAVALLDRGLCTFVIKVKNAQIAGASAVVIINNVANGTIIMSGTDATITIASAMISQADGNLIKTNLPATATLQTNGTPPANRDSDLDAGVIAHEYGHGISTRLTGGPSNVNCLNNAEQMGEGWSDWFGMTLTTRPTDTAGMRRGVGTYLEFQASSGVGIRPTPYSTDMAIDPATYASVADTAGISLPHGIGYVWNSMLWEIYWNLVHRHGYNNNLYAPWSTAGNNLAFQLVMDGLKMQPCSPGFVDGRNAILAADTALTGGANQCEIWRGFAKRGLGSGASQGSSSDRSDGVQAFDLPAACTVAVFGGFSNLLAAPALNTLTAGQTRTLAFSLTGVSGLPKLDTQAVNCNTLEPLGEAPIALNSSTGLQQAGSNYSIDWRTSKSWNSQCRAVTVRIPAASDPLLYFRFPESPGQVLLPNQ